MPSAGATTTCTFVVHGREYGIAYVGGVTFLDDPHGVTLSGLGLRERERFRYEYDFIDRWSHDVRVERVLPADPGLCYPVCTGGRRAVPPEGCGGPWAFMELRQRFAPFRLAERLVEIIEAVLSGSDNVDDLREELEELRLGLRSTASTGGRRTDGWLSSSEQGAWHEDQGTGGDRARRRGRPVGTGTWPLTGRDPDASGPRPS